MLPKADQFCKDELFGQDFAQNPHLAQSSRLKCVNVYNVLIWIALCASKICHKFAILSDKVEHSGVSSFWGCPVLFRDLYFCINYLLALLATFVATTTLDQLGGLHGGHAVLLVLPMIASAMIEGQQFARRYRMKPTVRECWQASLRMTALIILMMLTVFIPMILVHPDTAAKLATIDPTGRASVYVLLCFLSCCLLRVGYAIGLATELKAQQFPDN